MKPGDRFKVATTQMVKDRKGRVLARYRPEFDYAVTPRNLEMVNDMETKNIASRHEGPTRESNQAVAGAAKVKGRASTGKGKGK